MTYEGRHKERYRRLLLSTLASIFAKSISLLTTLISVPLTLNYLGVERYGLWMTISSTITLLGFADLGLGNGLVNAIAEADGKDDREGAKRAITSGTFMLFGIGVVILVSFILIYPVVPWPNLFKLTNEIASREAGLSVLVFITCFAINLPLGVVQRVQLGYQEGFLNNLWQSIGNILGLIGVLIVINVKAGLPWLVLAMAGLPLVAWLANWLNEFIRIRPWLLPRWAYFDWEIAKQLAATGGLFFAIQISALFGGESIDNLVITRILDPSSVSLFAVTQKYFTIALMAQIFLIPLWPAFGEALARRDKIWVRKAFNRAMIVSVGGVGVLSILLTIVGKQVIRIWAGPSVIPGSALLLGTACLAIMNGYKGCISMLFNSGVFLRRQLPYFLFGSILSLILKIVLCKFIGIAGVAWGGIIGYTLIYLLPLTVIVIREVYSDKGINRTHQRSLNIGE
jgi:O-antigen/teichoic acid export membrane protein